MRYILGFLITIGLIIMVFVLIFRGGPDSPDQPTTPTDMMQYTNTDAVMRMTTDGIINADQNHRAIRITIGRSASSVEVIRGYQNTVIEQRTYANNETAYATFLRALQIAGFTKRVTDANMRDERGVCPAGSRYIFEIMDGAAEKLHSWSTSCGTGNFKGNVNTVRSLFIRQIPDYDAISSRAGI